MANGIRVDLRLCQQEHVVWQQHGSAFRLSYEGYEGYLRACPPNLNSDPHKSAGAEETKISQTTQWRHVSLAVQHGHLPGWASPSSHVLLSNPFTGIGGSRYDSGLLLDPINEGGARCATYLDDVHHRVGSDSLQSMEEPNRHEAFSICKQLLICHRVLLRE